MILCESAIKTGILTYTHIGSITLKVHLYYKFIWTPTKVRRRHVWLSENNLRNGAGFVRSLRHISCQLVQFKNKMPHCTFLSIYSLLTSVRPVLIDCSTSFTVTTWTPESFMQTAGITANQFLVSINRLQSIVILTLFPTFFLSIPSRDPFRFYCLAFWSVKCQFMSKANNGKENKNKTSFKNFFRLVEWKWSLQGQKTTRGIGVYGPKMELSDLRNVSFPDGHTSAWVAYV